MFTTLNIVIGLVFVLLLFSLLVSTVMEVIASILSLRAQNLRYTLENMLGEKMDDFVRHPLFRQLSYATNRRTRVSSYSLPSNVSKDTFKAILRDFMGGEGNEGLARKIEALDEGDLKRMMQFLQRQSAGDLDTFNEQAGFWFDEIMTRSSEWYKRNLKWWLFVVGFVLACIFNVDTIEVYQSVSSNAIMNDGLVTMANDFVNRTDSVTGPNLNLPLDQSIARLDSSLQQVNPLGLGWQSLEADKNIPWWLLKLAGLLITGIAVTFGAPFWFDVLKKLLGKSNSPEKTTEVQPLPAKKPEVIVLPTNVVVAQPEETKDSDPTDSPPSVVPKPVG